MREVTVEVRRRSERCLNTEIRATENDEGSSQSGSGLGHPWDLVTDAGSGSFPRTQSVLLRVDPYNL